MNGVLPPRPRALAVRPSGCTPWLTSLALALALATGSARADDAPPPVSWATAQAAESARAGREHASRGEPDAALRSFLDAVAFDVTYAPAYLALGEMYESRGDVTEAERAYSMGIEHVAGFVDALVGRARLRARARRSAEAIADLEAAAGLRPDAQSILRDLVGAYVAFGALPAALAVSRRRIAVAEAQGDRRGASDARAEARALAGLVREADPVVAGGRGRGAVRRALWAADRQR
jgi:tetratricopeptide (TPR) repeat protein